MSKEEFIFVPEGDQHVVIPINQSDGQVLQDLANGYRGSIEWNLQSHDGTNIILYFINEKDLEADETIKYDG